MTSLKPLPPESQNKPRPSSAVSPLGVAVGCRGLYQASRLGWWLHCQRPLGQPSDFGLAVAPLHPIRQRCPTSVAALAGWDLQAPKELYKSRPAVNAGGDEHPILGELRRLLAAFAGCWHDGSRKHLCALFKTVAVVICHVVYHVMRADHQDNPVMRSAV